MARLIQTVVARAITAGLFCESTPLSWGIQAHYWKNGNSIMTHRTSFANNFERRSELPVVPFGSHASVHAAMDRSVDGDDRRDDDAILRAHAVALPRGVSRAGERRLGRLTALVGVAYFLVWAVLGMAVFPMGGAIAAVEMRDRAVAGAVPMAAGVVC